MSENSLDPAKIISVLEILLAQLEASLSPQIYEGDTRSESLKNQIDGYRDKTARLKKLLGKHKSAQSRKKELNKQNKVNSRPKGKTVNETPDFLKGSDVDQKGLPVRMKIAGERRLDQPYESTQKFKLGWNRLHGVVFLPQNNN